MSTPYITPSLLTMLPTGYAWKNLPGVSSGTADAYQAQLQLCREATAWVDVYCNQTLRCTSDSEMLTAPGPRVAANAVGGITIFPTRQPILSVVKLETRPFRATEADWTAADSTNYWTLAAPGLSQLNAGDGTREVQAVGIGIDRRWPDGTFLIRLTYLNGWPHGGLTAAGTVGTSTLAVDSVLGFTVGETPRIDDGLTYEIVTVNAITTNADGVSGTLTLSAPTVYAHGVGTPVTLLPEIVVTETGYYAASLAYRKGSLALAVPSVDGNAQTAKLASGGDWETRVRKDLVPFRRDY